MPHYTFQSSRVRRNVMGMRLLICPLLYPTYLPTLKKSSHCCLKTVNRGLKRNSLGPRMSWLRNHGKHPGSQVERSSFDTGQAWLLSGQAKRISQTVSPRRRAFHNSTLPFEQRHFPHFAAADSEGHRPHHRRVHSQSLILNRISGEFPGSR